MDPRPCSAASKNNAGRNGDARRRPCQLILSRESTTMIDDLSWFAPNAILIGEGSRADRIWTRHEFMQLCDLMRNDNPANEFLHVYCDPSGAPRFVKAKSPD